VLTIRCKIVCQDLKPGDSVAVNGICLTVTSCDRETFVADVMSETINRSSIGNMKSGARVNLERAMPANGRFGGHFVSGHTDGVGVIAKISRDENAIRYSVNADSKLIKYIVEKGSIAVDGISLTVTESTKEGFGFSIIPHTAKQTILSEKKIGDIVNLENDIIGKYIEKLIYAGSNGNNSSNADGRNGNSDSNADGRNGNSDSNTDGSNGRNGNSGSNAGITEEFLAKHGFF